MSGLRISAVNQRAAGGILNTHMHRHTECCVHTKIQYDHMPTKYSMYTQYVFHYNSAAPQTVKLSKSVIEYAIAQ